MGICNFCTISQMKARAKKAGGKVTIVKAEPLYNGCVDSKDVYIHPAGVSIKDLTKTGRKKYWAMTVASLSNHCVC